MLLALAFAALLQTQPVRPAAQEPTPLSGIDIVAPNGTPKIVSTYPAAGAAVAPGPLVLTVRFDHRMNPAGFSYSTGEGAPACLDKPRLLADEKTFVLLCSVGFNQSFTVRMNVDCKGFVDLAAKPADSASLAFTTTGGEPTATVADALKAAGLKDIDSPILDSKPAGG
ncbi:hypothetical protein BH09PSE2_BH09PSE2_02840 [soil metagenome]